MGKQKLEYLLIFLIFLCTCFLPYAPVTNAKYIEKKTKELTINAVQPTYTIIFDANGGTGSMAPQVFTYKTAQNLKLNTFTKGIESFNSWNTEPDGSGTKYLNGQSIYNLTNVNGATITLYAQWTDKAARIGDTTYETLAAAVAVANASTTQTEIILLKDVDEKITINKNKSVILDLQGHVLQNVTTDNDNTIKNNGTLILRNGTVRNNAPTNGAINNYSTGTITLDGVNVYVYGTGNRQALYNDGGIATITGGSHLESRSTERVAVHNKGNNAVMRVIDATIISTGHSGLKNDGGTLYIGNDQDGTVNNTNPYVRGYLYGLETNNIRTHFYDGIFSGKQRAVDNPGNLSSIPDGYMIIDGTEIVDTVKYLTKFTNIGCTVTFDPNGGTLVDEGTRVVVIDNPIGTFPRVTYVGWNFLGWFTDPVDGEEVTADTIVTDDTTYYAHWERKIGVAKIGDQEYDTLVAAVNAVPNNVETNILLQKDTSEKITIPQGKNIVIDLNDHTMSNEGDAQVFINNGTLKLIGGTITSDADFAAIDQNKGSIIIDGVHITCTGTRQALYVSDGEATVTGDAYFTSTATGTPSTSSVLRGAIQVMSAGKLNVLSGTFIGENQNAISSQGTVTIGTKDGTVDATKPVFIGKMDGIYSIGTLKFYDGIAKGENNAINGTISDQETGATLINGTDGDYHTAYLEIPENSNNAPSSPNNAPALPPQDSTNGDNDNDTDTDTDAGTDNDNGTGAGTGNDSSNKDEEEENG